jgi:hypothetical protein
MRAKRRLGRVGVLAAAAGACVPAAAQQRLNFVSCPIVRDTPTVPCWLTEYDGELYYMGIQTDVSADFHPPYLGHRVLVEAVVSDAPRICGGIVLDPITISVMPEIDPSCNTMLPADPRYTIDFNPRPPGPSAGRLAFDAPSPPPKESLSPPYEVREFELDFDFDRGISFRHARPMTQIVDYAKAISATRVRVRGSRGATRLSDGSLVTESAGIARRRAEQVAALLGETAGGAAVETSWSGEPAAADGIDDWRSRSVDVSVEP